MTTVADLIEETKRVLYGAVRQPLNRLASAVNTTDLTWTLEFDLKGAVEETVLSIDDEMVYVFSRNQPGKTVTVHRGYLGTTPAAHSVGDLVEVNPRFPRYQIKNALRQEIDSWAPKLYRVTPFNLTSNGSTRSFDVPYDDVLHLVDVRSSITGSTTHPRLLRTDLVRDLDINDFASGTALLVLGNLPGSAVYRARVARPFDLSTWDDDTDLEEDLGIASYMMAIPPIGAAWRIMSSREIPRTNTGAQPEPRRAEENPPGHINAIANGLKTLRDVQISEAMVRLGAQYPVTGF